MRALLLVIATVLTGCLQDIEPAKEDPTPEPSPASSINTWSTNTTAAFWMEATPNNATNVTISYTVQSAGPCNHEGFMVTPMVYDGLQNGASRYISTYEHWAPGTTVDFTYRDNNRQASPDHPVFMVVAPCGPMKIGVALEGHETTWTWRHDLNLTSSIAAPTADEWSSPAAARSSLSWSVPVNGGGFSAFFLDDPRLENRDVAMQFANGEVMQGTGRSTMATGTNDYFTFVGTFSNQAGEDTVELNRLGTTPTDTIRHIFIEYGETRPNGPGLFHLYY